VQTLLISSVQRDMSRAFTRLIFVLNWTTIAFSIFLQLTPLDVKAAREAAFFKDIQEELHGMSDHE
jgi:hypothetical protein